MGKVLKRYVVTFPMVHTGSEMGHPYEDIKHHRVEFSTEKAAREFIAQVPQVLTSASAEPAPMPLVFTIEEA